MFFLKKQMSPANFHFGFTLIELLLVMGIISALLAVSSILVLNLIPKTSLSAQHSLIISEIRSQQFKAMTGEKNSVSGSPSHGIYFAPHSYILFQGEGYDEANPTNFEIELSPSFEVATNLVAQQVVFTPGNGEVKEFDKNLNEIIIKNTQNQTYITLNINRYGIVSVIYE